MQFRSLAALVKAHKEPPTDSIVKGDAVGLSRIASSSEVKGINGIMEVRRGTRSKIITGKPIAAIVCTMENVAPKPIS